MPPPPRPKPRRTLPSQLFCSIIPIPSTTFLSIFTLIFAYYLTFNPPHSAPSRLATQPPPPNIAITAAPTLQTLLADIADALDAHQITYWLQPGLALIPSTSQSSLGKLTPWHYGVDLAAFQSDLMPIILAQTSLQRFGIVSVESYFGLRLFSLSGRQDERYDFRTPFVDVIYMKRDKGNLVSYCCDCDAVRISACTKKTCGCLVCAVKEDDVFPLAHVQVEGVRRLIPAPRDEELLLLQRRLDDVHPAVFDL